MLQINIFKLHMYLDRHIDIQIIAYSNELKQIDSNRHLERNI
jgi:hypothetical protein